MARVEFKNLKDLPVRITDSVGSATSLVIHTIFFAGIFALKLFGMEVASIMLILTTIVSLEAIYLSIFIQMTVNRNTQSLVDVEEDLDVIQGNVDEIQENVDEIQEDLGEIQEDVDEIQEGDEQDAKEEARTQALLEDVGKRLQALMVDIEKLKK